MLRSTISYGSPLTCISGSDRLKEVGANRKISSIIWGFTSNITFPSSDGGTIRIFIQYAELLYPKFANRLDGAKFLLEMSCRVAVADLSSRKPTVSISSTCALAGAYDAVRLINVRSMQVTRRKDRISLLVSIGAVLLRDVVDMTPDYSSKSGDGSCVRLKAS